MGPPPARAEKPDALRMLIGGYVVEGHVPMAAIKKLLKERPAIKGISLPGKPETEKTGPFTIYEVSDGAKVFMVDLAWPRGRAALRARHSPLWLTAPGSAGTPGAPSRSATRWR